MLNLTVSKQFMVWVIAGLKIKYFSLSIRTKLLLISAVLVVVPWIGVQYIQDMENFLRSNQEKELLGRAQIVAAVLQGQEDVFKSRSVAAGGINNFSGEVTADAVQAVSPVSHLYVRPLNSSIQLDGYMDDWANYAGRQQIVSSEDPQSLQYRSYIGTYKKYLYVMFNVTDESVVYRKANSLSLENGDHLRIVIKNLQGEINNYFIATQSPGWVNAHRMQYRDNEWVAIAPELRIKGEWQQSATGYNVEIRLPLNFIGDNLSFFVADVDNKSSGKIERIIGSTPSPDKLATIIIPSVEVEDMLKRVVRPASRTWIIDQQYRVLAVAGDLKQPAKYTEVEEMEDVRNESFFPGNIIQLFYQMLLKQPTHNFKDDLSSASYLQGETVQSALKGKPAINWRDTPDNRVRILTATYPVIKQGKTIGVIAIEETSNSILILQNRAMEILINLSVLTFFITVIVLLSYATRLSMRIRNLRDQTDMAITSDGRILSNIKKSRVQDEIGDLSRSFSDMLSRLAEYNRYLETMAGKLSHELRTPITVARSSLDNLVNAQTDEDRKIYIERASEGMARLSDILTRMSEATRLEQTIQSETLEPVKLNQLLENCISAYKLAYPKAFFELEVAVKKQLTLMASAELIAQMLDKLVSNAVDFSLAGTPIIIRLLETDSDVIVSVTNQGETLPDHMQENLFESMVSVRSKRGDRPHLGLGLYIVRMIAEFHKASVKAKNTKDKKGVEIVVKFPLLE